MSHDTSTGASPTRHLYGAFAPVCATLDRDLVIRRVNQPYRNVLGRSAFELVLPSHHDLLRALAHELFTRRRMVSGAFPTVCAGQERPFWWFVRAAPLSRTRRARGAFVRALPRDQVDPAEWHPVSLEVWERRRAFRDLLPIFPHLPADL